MPATGAGEGEATSGTTTNATAHGIGRGSTNGSGRSGTKGSGIGSATLGQVALTVGDLDKAKDFYGQALGFKLLFAMDRMAFFDCGNLRLMLSLPEADFKPGAPGAVLYFKVDSAAEAGKALAAEGIDFVKPPHRVARMGAYDLWMGFFRDPDGNHLAVMSEEKPASRE